MTRLYDNLTVFRETRDRTSLVYTLLITPEKLDASVATAYGWTWPMPNEEILSALLALNLERAAQLGAALTPMHASAAEAETVYAVSLKICGASTRTL